MKIGILTFPHSTSFGASLQMYALYHAVKTLNADVEIVNYQNVYMKKEKHTSASRSMIIKKIARKMLHLRQKIAFQRFEKEMKRYPPHTTYHPQLLTEIGKRYDGVICGSDQIWNPDITGFDLSFFLDFCLPPTRRISYAPSFGLDCLPPDFARNVRLELEKFDHLSVREYEGQEIVRHMIKKTVPVVADPTFLLTKEDWTKQERRPAAACEGYILYYTVHSSKTLETFCRNLARRKSKKIIFVGGNVFRRARNKDGQIDYACNIGPREWLYLLHHADCVVTNSFHGTAFALNYQKDFYVEFSSSTNSRLENIVRTTGLQDRIVCGGKNEQDGSIDYIKVTAILNKLRDQSWEYLKKSVRFE